MKNNCPDDAQVSAYADGELDVMDAARMESHLAGCENCGKLLASYRGIDNLIQNLPEMEVTNSFDRVFRNRLETAAASPGWVLQLKYLLTGWRPVLGAAAAVCLVAGIFFYHGLEREVLNPEDIVIVENLDFFQHVEILQKLELLENWESISIVNDPS